MRKLLLFLFCLLPILGHGQSQIDQFQVFQLGYNASPGNPPSFTGYVYINSSGQLVCTLHNGTSCLSGGGSGTGTIIASPSPDCLPYYQGANTTLTADCALVTDTAGGLTLVKLTVSGATTGVITLKTGSAPANPASGNGSLYIDSITQNLTCINSSGGTCMPATVTSVFGRAGVVAAVSGDYTWDQIGAGSNLNVQTMGSGGSMSPLNSGQVAGNQLWIPAGLPTTTASIANTGGSVNTTAVNIQITLNSALGESLPGLTFFPTSGSCATSNCQVTVVAPTLPSGYTGYTVYDCQANAPAICTALRQASGTACVNITGNCIINSIGAGPATPTINTAVVQPPNVQANNGSLGSIPGAFFPKVDGNYYPWISVNTTDCDATNGPPLPCGTPVFTHRTWFNDIGGPTVAYPAQTQAFKNAFVSIDHCSGCGTVLTNQDRALGILMQNSATDTNTIYSLFGTQIETDFNGAPTFSAHPDGGVGGLSVQVSDSHTNVATTGMSAIGGVVYIQNGFGGTFGSCGSRPCITGVGGSVVDFNTSGGGNNAVAGGSFGASNGNGSQTTRQGYAVYVDAPSSSSRFGASNIGLYIEPWLSSATNKLDRSFIFDGNTTVPSKGVIQSALWLGGQQVAGQCAICSNYFSNSSGAIAGLGLPITGSPQVTGSISTTQLANLGAPTCNVTGGAGTNYTYTWGMQDGNGGTTTGGTCTKSAAAVLDGSNFINVSATFSPAAFPGAVRIPVCRTASSGTPATTGLIGYFAATLGDPESVNTGYNFSDTGLATIGACPVGTANTTGGITAYNFGTLTNCSATGTAASPSVAACGAASAGAFSCATNASAATCTINTSAVTANSEIFVTINSSEGTRLGVTCATSANITVLPTVLLASKSSGVSFTINTPTFTVNPVCFDYMLVN